MSRTYHYVTIPYTALAAAVTCAAKIDIREYLKAVCIERTTDGKTYAVGSDGRILFAGRVHDNPREEPTRPGPWSVVIPRTAVEFALKARKVAPKHLAPSHIDLAESEGRFSLGAFEFEPVDDRYPTWRKMVTPDYTTSPTPHQFNPHMLVRASTALAEWKRVGSSKDTFSSFAHLRHVQRPGVGDTQSPLGIVTGLTVDTIVVLGAYLTHVEPCDPLLFDAGVMPGATK